MSVISTATNTVTATATVGATLWGGGHPQRLVRLRDQPGTGTVSVINAATNAVTATVSSAPPRGGGGHPQRPYAYVTNFG